MLNSTDQDFQKTLHDVCHNYESHLGFDALAEPLSFQVLEAMPPQSRLTVNGGISQEPAMANPEHLIFHQKVLDDFWLTSFLLQLNLVKFIRIWRRAQKLLSAELKSEIRVQYPLKDIKTAVQDYQNQMTGSKVLIKP